MNSVSTARKIEACDMHMPELIFNSALADAFGTLNTKWRVEGPVQSDVSGFAAHGLSNLSHGISVFHESGASVAIVSEYQPALSVEDDALNRLESNLNMQENPLEMAIALKIPKQFENMDQNGIQEHLKSAEFEFCLHSLLVEKQKKLERWPESGWIKGCLHDLMELIEVASLSEYKLQVGMDILENAISNASDLLRKECEDNHCALQEIAQSLQQMDGNQTSRMAMSIVFNAMMYHKSLQDSDNVKALDEFWDSHQTSTFDKQNLLDSWVEIAENLNCLPIFEIAEKILFPIEDRVCSKLLELLYQASLELDKLGATSRYDLCGRMFQRLISDRKFLATYYTLPVSSAMLAEIAIGRLDKDWSEENELKKLRIADFACGTGALLNASLNSIVSKGRYAGADVSAIQKFMVEDVLVGTNIMPVATHLTSSMFASSCPGAKFEHTSIFTLPYGIPDTSSAIRSLSLGALELLECMPSLQLIDSGERRLTANNGKISTCDLAFEFPDESFDIVIMNPPFTRPTSHESDKSEIPIPSFAGLETSEEEQRLMSERLKMITGPNMVGNGFAGLASNFIDIAHAKVKSPNGIVALVLPSTFLKGESWEDARRLFETEYSDTIIMSISSSGQAGRAFSSDTSMAEVLIVATRDNGKKSNPVRFVNLVRRPESVFEAVMIARNIIRNPTATEIRLGDSVIAAVHYGDFDSVGLAGTLNLEPVKAAQSLIKGKLSLPNLANPQSIPMTTLGNLGKVGLLHRHIHGRAIGKDGLPHGPFDLISNSDAANSNFPILWAHNASSETRLVVRPDFEGKVCEGCEEKAVDVWNRTKSKLHFNLDFRFNSQPLAACSTETETIGGRAWPNFICHEIEWEFPLLLWANTTLGLISYWWHGGRQQLGRSIITRLTLSELPVLDVRKLNDSQLDFSSELFNRFKPVQFKPANEAWRDLSRHALDKAVLGEILGFSEQMIMEGLSNLRSQWCKEPTVHGGKSTAPID